MGFFSDALHRRLFIFALLDNCSFERKCPMCSGLYKDILKHTLDRCPKAAHCRLLLKFKLAFYNAPAYVNIKDKHQLYLLAISGKHVFVKVICEYLTGIGMY